MKIKKNMVLAILCRLSLVVRTKLEWSLRNAVDDCEWSWKRIRARVRARSGYGVLCV